MTVAQNDYVLPLKADGVTFALPFDHRPSSTDYLAKAKGSDGKIIAAGLEPIDAGGMYGYRAECADGKTAGLGFMPAGTIYVYNTSGVFQRIINTGGAISDVATDGTYVIGVGARHRNWGDGETYASCWCYDIATGTLQWTYDNGTNSFCACCTDGSSWYLLSAAQVGGDHVWKLNSSGGVVWTSGVAPAPTYAPESYLGPMHHSAGEGAVFLNGWTGAIQVCYALDDSDGSMKYVSFEGVVSPMAHYARSRAPSWGFIFGYAIPALSRAGLYSVKYGTFGTPGLEDADYFLLSFSGAVYDVASLASGTVVWGHNDGTNVLEAVENMTPADPSGSGSQLWSDVIDYTPYRFVVIGSDLYGIDGASAFYSYDVGASHGDLNWARSIPTTPAAIQTDGSSVICVGTAYGS